MVNFIVDIKELRYINKKLTVQALLKIPLGNMTSFLYFFFSFIALTPLLFTSALHFSTPIAFIKKHLLLSLFCLKLCYDYSIMTYFKYCYLLLNYELNIPYLGLYNSSNLITSTMKIVKQQQLFVKECDIWTTMSWKQVA